MALWSSNSPGIRLRLNQTTPKMRFRVTTRLPSTLQAQNGDQVSNSGGVWTIGPAYPTLGETASISSGDLAHTFFRIYNDSGLTYSRTKLSTILTSISANLDATLVAIAATTPTTDQGLYFSATDVAAAYSLTAQGRAIGGLGTTAGLVAVTGAGTSTVRTLTGTSNEITVSNGTGASGNPTFSLPSTLTFTGKTVTAGTFSGPTISGGTATALTGLAIRSTGAAYDLTFATAEVLTAGRTLSWVLGDAARTITLAGNITLGGALTTSGAYGLTFTLSGATSVTLPTSGTILSSASSAGGDLTGTYPSPTIATNAVSNAKFRQGVAVSVVGVTGSSTANVADITGSAYQVLRLNSAGTALAFGAIDLSQSAAATGVLQAASHPALTGDVTNSAGALATTISANAVTNAKSAQMAAYTFKGNTTGSTANPTDFTVAGLTHKASPTGSDLMMITDAAASNATKYSTLTEVLGAVVSGVSSLNGQTGALAVGMPVAQGRLTLVTALPVMTSTQSGKTTLYYTPYDGNGILLYDGTNFIPTTFSELSVATTDTTKSPAAIGVSKVNDWFVWSDSGTLRLGHGPDWTSDTARSASSIVRVNGVWLNDTTITNGPAAQRGTWVGTTRSNGSSQLDWILGGASSVAGWLGVWNAYNRVIFSSQTTDASGGVSYTTGAWRPAFNNAANRCSYVAGLAEDIFTARYICTCSGSAGGVAVGIGYDSTTAVSGIYGQGGTATCGASSEFSTQSLGFHYLQAVEYGATGGIFYGAGLAPSSAGIVLIGKM